MAASTSRSIPSLDGLRAGSIGLVIIGHSLAYLHGEPNQFPYLQFSELGQSGVDVFFVISGFLITYLLLKEYEGAGAIRLRTFYLRRFFRIFPPFYVYLGVVGILWASGTVREDVRNFFSAATYTWNYQLHRVPDWLLGHTWSLSLEEQFYLLWPPCLALLGKRRSMYIALGLILISPASRAVTYLLMPAWRETEWTMLHTRLDTIMFGCALALLWREERFTRWLDNLLHPALFTLSVLYIVILAPCLSARFQARYDWTVGYTLQGALISILLLYVVKKPASLPGRILNLRLIRHVGVISYGLYLWQQLFTGPRTFLFPLNLVAIFACAELSYFLVERPAFRLRDMIGERLGKPRATPNRNREAISQEISATNKDAITATED